MEVSSAHLRYLYAIYEISKTVPEVRSASVAKKMRVSKPSVARMLGVLMEKQLIVKELYGKIYLTDKGFLLARDFARKVRLLTERIPRMGLALTEEETYAAACAMALTLSVHEKPENAKPHSVRVWENLRGAKGERKCTIMQSALLLSAEILPSVPQLARGKSAETIVRK